MPSPYNKHRRTQSVSPQTTRRRYKNVQDESYKSIDWISRNNSSRNEHRASLPNFSPASVERVPSAKYGKTKSEILNENNNYNDYTLSYLTDTTKKTVGGAASAIAGLASSLWSSYGTKIASNTIDSTRNAEKKYSKTKQDVKKGISVVKSVKIEDVQRKLSSTVSYTVQSANKYVPSKLSNVPPITSTVSKLSTNVLKPLYQNNDNDDKKLNDNHKPSDFHNYSPPRRLPFEKPIKSNPEQKKMKIISDNKEQEEKDSDNESDIFNEEEIDEIAELMSNADTITTTTTSTTTTTTTSTMITYNVNISSFSIDDADKSKPASPTNIPLPSPTVSTNFSLSSHRSNRSDSFRSNGSSLSSRASLINYNNLIDRETHYISMFDTMKQTFEHYYYYNNKIMTPQQHLISRLRELEQIRINFYLCISKAFEYNLIEYDVTDFNKNIPQFDFHLFIEFNNDLQSSHSLNNARLYYLNYLQTFIFHINEKLNTYNEYYINHNNTLNRKNKQNDNNDNNDNNNNIKRGKISSISANLNISDRWNQFSRTVQSAMTTYAEDVKNLMGGQRRTLKSRMQFEYALGTKMGEVLNTVQHTINKHRHELNAAFLSQLQTKSITLSNNNTNTNTNSDDTSSFQEITTPTTTTTNDTDSKEDKTDEKDQVNGDAEETGDNNDNNNNTKKEVEETAIDDPLSENQTTDKEKEKEQIDDPLTTVQDDDPLGALNGDKTAKQDKNENDDDTKNSLNVIDDQIEEKKQEENPLMIIEEALAELKLVKDALLGNLDETQLESWLNWTFVEPSPEPNNNSSQMKLKPSSSNPPSTMNRRKKPPPPSASNSSLAHRRNLSSSGLPPPKKNVRNSPQPKVFSKSTSALKQHPLD